MPWSTIAQLLIKAAAWCLKNPSSVTAGIGEVKTIVDALHAAKAGS